MICPVCEGRWAPFPEDDFRFIKRKGYFPINSDAELRRGIQFDSDGNKYCGCEDDDWKHEDHYLTTHILNIK